MVCILINIFDWILFCKLDLIYVYFYLYSFWCCFSEYGIKGIFVVNLVVEFEVMVVIIKD